MLKVLCLGFVVVFGFMGCSPVAKPVEEARSKASPAGQKGLHWCYKVTEYEYTKHNIKTGASRQRSICE